MKNGGKKMSNQEYVEDEINLIDYFMVIWKRKWFILVGSIVPVLITGLIIYFLPRDYTITYMYDVKDQTTMVKDQTKDKLTMDVSNWNLDVSNWNLDVSNWNLDVSNWNLDVSNWNLDVSNWNLNEKNYDVLVSRFYSKENLDRIVSKLQQNDLNKYAELINNARGEKELDKLLVFEVLPPFIDIAKTKETDSAKLEELRLLEAQLLNITIITSSKKDIYKISSVIRENFETMIPIYHVADQLNVSIIKIRTKMAIIQENKFLLQLDLGKNKNILTKLKDIKPETLNKPESNIRLQFDVGGRSEYLPIEYQVQTAESRIIQIEETIKDNEKKHEYYKSLLSLNQKLLIEVKSKTLSHDTIQQFHSFLFKLAEKIEKEELKNYLNSYIKKIENRIAVNIPVIENPKVYPVAKGTVKKSAIVFAIALMISVFAAFLLEGLKKSK